MSSKIMSIQPPEGPVVAYVIDVLLEAGRHKYEFTADGVGCRQWITDSLSLLQALGWGNSDSYDAAKEAIAKLWPDEIDLPLNPGAYYE
jgi:hypothetical protein